MGQASPQPMVITTSAARMKSSVMGLGNSAPRSKPRWVITWTTVGLTSPAGRDPAERTWTLFWPRRSSNAAAIWDRPEVWVQTKSTSGTGLAMRLVAWASAVSRSAANRSARIGRWVLIRAVRYSVWYDSCTYRSMVSVLKPVSYTHLRAHETDSYLVCRLLLEKK